MTGPGGDDIDARVSRLEREVARLRERLAESASDSAAARVLASGADRDVSEVRAELRAHLHVLNALRETQAEMADRMNMMDNRIDAMGDRMDAGFATLNTGIAQIVALLSRTDDAE